MFDADRIPGMAENIKELHSDTLNFLFLSGAVVERKERIIRDTEVDE